MRALLLLIVGVSTLLGCEPAARLDKAAASPVPPKDPWTETQDVVLAPSDPGVEKMSFVRILADLKAVDGRSVATGGYMHLEFEGDRFCLHQDDVENLIVSNCLSISVPDTPAIRAMSDHYVLLEGVVSTKSRGHMGMSQAGIIEVKRIYVPPTRTKIEAHREWQRRNQ